jgi:ubiquinone/menaquinone biosynthesis C-methylase UbiE
MKMYVLTAFATLCVLLFLTALFFFVLTRGALLLRSLSPQQSATSHVYPIYSNMRLIKLVDYQPLISAILLFQYPRLVSRMVTELQRVNLAGKKLLVTSCAFGNVIPRVVEAAVQSGVSEVLISDIVDNELLNAQSKLQPYASKIRYLPDNAIAMQQPDASVDVNVLFFLLHELPHPLKALALNEACRVLKPGGTLFIGEFHRPRIAPLRALSWLYFKVFEPYGLALWDQHDPVAYLRSIGEWKLVRNTYFFSNFQMITATKI